MRVSALLWVHAREVGNRWTVSQLEPFKVAVRQEIEAGDTAQLPPPLSESSSGALAKEEAMDVDGIPLAVQQRRLQNVGQAR